MPSITTRIDVREIEPRQRHPLIFSRFGELATGEALEVVSDHDPQPLHRQFELLAPDEFSWEYLEEGPVTWRVAIARANAPRASGCCGGCGGGA